METAKVDPSKSPEMVMCGDHSSFTKTLLNIKETKAEERLKSKESKEKMKQYQTKISPSPSRAGRTRSEHALGAAGSAGAARRSLDLVRRTDVDVAMHRNRALVQAAVGSFRWPPYLVAVWVLVLMLTHLLHCVVTMLERVLPALKTACQYFRLWTEESWKAEQEPSRRMYPAGLACVTGLLYSLYFGLYALHALALWSVEPLCSDTPEERADPKVTNYDNDSGILGATSKLM